MPENYLRFKSRVSRQLADHEERIGVAEDRLDKHEQDIAGLEEATKALRRIDARRLAAGRARPKVAKRKR